MNPYSDLPDWIWDVEVGGRPRLFLAAGVANRDLLLWRWVYFLSVLPLPAWPPGGPWAFGAVEYDPLADRALHG